MSSLTKAVLQTLPSDIRAFLLRYPEQSQYTGPVTNQQNLRFHHGSLPMSPDNVTITQVHREWRGQYALLEQKHGFIQWLFPIREQGVNPLAQPLNAYEIKLITQGFRQKVLDSLALMLDFYGMEFAGMDSSSLRLVRTTNYVSRYLNLCRSGHNSLRVTRILKCLSEFQLEDQSVSLLLWVLVEQSRGELDTRELRSSMDRYWCWCLRDDRRRELVHRVMARVRSGRILTEQEYVDIVTRHADTGRWDDNHAAPTEPALL